MRSQTNWPVASNAVGDCRTVDGPAVGDSAEYGPAVGDSAEGGPAVADSAEGGPAVGDSAEGGPAVNCSAEDGPAVDGNAADVCNVKHNYVRMTLFQAKIQHVDLQSSMVHRPKPRSTETGNPFYKCYTLRC